jgi:high-affinity iron transporter
LFTHRWVYLGVISAVIASFVVGLILNLTIQGLQTSDLRYAPVFKKLFEMGLGLIATSILSWILIWMIQQAKLLKAEIQSYVTSALDEDKKAAWAIFSLIFIAVFREGLETYLLLPNFNLA